MLPFGDPSPEQEGLRELGGDVCGCSNQNMFPGGGGARALVGSPVVRQGEAFLHPDLLIHSLNKIHYSFLCVPRSPWSNMQGSRQ